MEVLEVQDRIGQWNPSHRGGLGVQGQALELDLQLGQPILEFAGGNELIQTQVLDECSEGFAERK